VTHLRSTLNKSSAIYVTYFGVRNVKLVQVGTCFDGIEYVVIGRMFFDPRHNFVRQIGFEQVLDLHLNRVNVIKFERVRGFQKLRAQCELFEHAVFEPDANFLLQDLTKTEVRLKCLHAVDITYLEQSQFVHRIAQIKVELSFGQVQCQTRLAKFCFDLCLGEKVSGRTW
jgi:hypothetical protein